MKTNSISRSAFFIPRLVLGLTLCLAGVLLAIAALNKSGAQIPAAKGAASQPGTWTVTGSMNIARFASKATRLNNGKILVTGGVDESGNATDTAELYDSITGTWTRTASMSVARNAHSATLLPDGKVLIAGGSSCCLIPLASAEIYDPDTGTWTPTGDMNAARVAHLATLLPTGALTGKVLATGGLDENYVTRSSAELYDPSTGVWSDTGSMRLPRYWDNPSPTTLPDGSVLIVGGTTCCPYHWLNEAELYNPVNQTWIPTSLKVTYANEVTTLLPNGLILVAGGVKGTQPTSKAVADAELFNAVIGEWSAAARMSTDRADHTLTFLPSGEALVAGGLSGGWGVCDDINTAELYNSDSGIWVGTGNMTAARFYHTATLLPNGQVLVAGGTDCEGHVLSSAELYTPPPVATLSPTSLAFRTQLVNTRSAGQTATLTNTGTTPLTISGITASADFLQKNNCGSSLAPGASCTIKVAFAPSVKGVLTGSVTITDDAANSPQTIALAGTGTVVQVTPPGLEFGDQAVGTTSDPQTATITNTSNTELHIAGIAVRGTHYADFAETTTCGTRLTAGESCAVNVTFTPAAKGGKHANVLIQDDGGDGPQAVHLTGNGVSN